jgi:hypothetical protein
VNFAGDNEKWKVTLPSKDAYLGLQERGKPTNNVSFSGSFVDPIIKNLPSPRKNSPLRVDSSSDLVNASVSMEEIYRGKNKNSNVLEEQCREKKVTFVLETFKKPCLNAQIRRQNFRNSYSKGSKIGSVQKTVDSYIDAELSESPLSSRLSPGAQMLEEGADLKFSTAGLGASPRSVNVDRLKQQQTTNKRKLKSCRSRSFHKSLDSSFVHQDTISRFSYNKKPLKAVHPDVVTMISLVQPEDADAELNNISKTPSASAIPEIDVSTLVNSEDDDDRNGGVHKPILTKVNQSDQSITGVYKIDIHVFFSESELKHCWYHGPSAVGEKTLSFCYQNSAIGQSSNKIESRKTSELF